MSFDEEKMAIVSLRLRSTIRGSFFVIKGEH